MYVWAAEILYVRRNYIYIDRDIVYILIFEKVIAIKRECT